MMIGEKKVPEPERPGRNVSANFFSVADGTESDRDGRRSHTAHRTARHHIAGGSPVGFTRRARHRAQLLGVLARSMLLQQTAAR